MVTLLSGCTPAPEHSSDDGDVVNARVAAHEAFPDVASLATDGSGMTLLASHAVDACGTARNQQGFVGHEDLGLRCTLSSIAVFSLPAAADDIAAAAVIDAFLAANGAVSETSMVAQVEAIAAVRFSPPPSLATLDDPGFVVKLFDASDLTSDMQYLPVSAGQNVISDEGDWPSDVVTESLATGSLHFAVVETFVEYFNSQDVRPTHGPSERGGENETPPCYGTSGHCPGG
ncbi:hypothetical protein [Conyzicola nivalis]